MAERRSGSIPRFAPRDGVETLFAAADRLNQASEPEEVLSSVVQVAALLLNVERVAIATDEGDHLLRRYTWDVDAWHQTEVRLPLEGSIAGWVTTHARSYRSNDLKGEDELGGVYKYNSVLAVPITAHDGQVLGVLNVHEPLDNRAFSDDDERLARGIAHLAAVALERSRFVRRIRRSEALLRALERNASDVMAILDEEGVLQYLGANAGRVLGIDPGAARGRSVFDFLGGRDAGRVQHVLRRFKERGYAVGRARLHLPLGPDSWREIEATARNQFDDPDLGGLVLNIRDVGDYTRVERELENRTRQLEAKTAEQEAYVHEVSHALKTPLASIVAMAEVLEQDVSQVGGIWPDGLALIRRVSARMTGIVNDLLALARASAGLDDLELMPVALDEVMDTVVHDLATQIASRAVRLRIDSPLPVVLGHAGRLAEVYTNLIDNAIKYTPPERAPEIEIGAQREGDAVVCWVCDNGVGIPPDQRERIFGLFQRLEDGRTASIGSGVGLAVASRIVDRLGGRIWVEGASSGGACFWISLHAASLGPRAPRHVRAI